MLEGQFPKMDSLNIWVCYVTTIWALRDSRLVEDKWKDNQMDGQAGKHNTDTAT